MDKVQSFCNQIRALLSNLMSKQTTKGKNVTIKRFDTNSGKVCNGRNSEFQKASVRLWPVNVRQTDSHPAKAIGIYL